MRFGFGARKSKKGSARVDIGALPTKFFCCLCAQTIEASSTNPCSLHIASRIGRDQMYFCHGECFASHLAPGPLFTPRFLD